LSRLAAAQKKRQGCDASPAGLFRRNTSAEDLRTAIREKRSGLSRLAAAQKNGRAATRVLPDSLRQHLPLKTYERRSAKSDPV
jgi:hypothetical protein